MANTTDGILFAGPPNFNTLFRQFSDHGDASSPEVQPIYQDGRIVRFANDTTTGIPPLGQPWAGTVMRPAGITPQKLTDLRKIISEVR